MKSVQQMPHIRDLKLFDSCVTLGRLAIQHVPEYLTADNILAVMDKHDIAEALVHSSEARLVWPRSRGNERLLKETKGMPRLHPVWVLSPSKKPDPVGARRLVQDMLAAGVRAARLMMGVAPPFHWLWKETLEALEEHRVPCLLDFAASTGATTMCVPNDAAMDPLREVCLAHPKLPFIISGAVGGLGLAFSTIALIHRVPNLFMDINAIVDHWREVARNVGPERVIFATGMPFCDPSVLVSNVQYEPSLRLEAKRLICGDNLRGLLEAGR